MSFGNVNVKYSPCKSVAQLKSAEKYMLGKKSEQIKSGVVKTAPDSYSALGCSRDNFANNVLVTRKLNGKSYGGKTKANEVLAHKMSISFSPKDNHKLNYRKAFEIANQFAEKFAHEKGHEVLFAVHTDTPHIHIHFLISNCNIHTGKAYRRNKKDLYDMSKYFGELCLENGLTNSVRDEFYNKDLERQKDKLTLTEKKMAERGKETFKDELREVIREEVNNPDNKTFDDVIKSLYENYNVETRVAGNTVSYRHPEYRDKNNNLVSVRGSKLGEMYTRKGIEYVINKKSREHTVHPARGNETPLGEYIVAESSEFARVGRQIQTDPDVRDIGTVSRGIDSFYDRYRKPIEVDESRADEIVESAKRVQKRSQNRSR